MDNLGSWKCSAIQGLVAALDPNFSEELVGRTDEAGILSDVSKRFGHWKSDIVTMSDFGQLYRHLQKLLNEDIARTNPETYLYAGTPTKPAWG